MANGNIQVTVNLPRCATCKHWEVIPNGHKNECTRIKFDWDYNPEPESDPVVTDPSSLWTPPTFGCTLHETKDQA